MNTPLIRDEVRVEVSQNNQPITACIMREDQVDSNKKILEVVSQYICMYPGKLVRVLRTVSMTEILATGSGK